MKTTDPNTSLVPFPSLGLFELLRQRLLSVWEAILDEELGTRLGAERHQRGEARCGYRHGAQEREILTDHGPLKLRIPRGRLFREDGSTEEWRSQVLPRFSRRTARVDETLLGAYFAGANTRRVRRALQPLLGERFLSKSAISRIVQRVQALFETWRTRDLSQERYALLSLDALYLPVRLARRVVKVPVQAVLGVRAEDGQKVLLALEIAASESTAAWQDVVRGLAHRGLASPLLVTLDGNSGLVRAVKEAWPQALVQRCTRHKLQNLLAKAPRHTHSEIRRDYHKILHASSVAAVQAAYQVFLAKWRKLLPEVARSLEEAGEDLLTFTHFPKSQWRTLRTTNQLERLNGEFRRRTKTQGSFRTEAAALVLLYGLVAFGQIRLRKIDGWKELKRVCESLREAA